ncbi:hypothetical protein N2152v2_011152 [Parachlorella kessleri]
MPDKTAFRQARPPLAVPRCKAAAGRDEEDWSLGAASAAAAATGTAQQHADPVEGDDTAEEQFDDFLDGFEDEDEDEAGGPAVHNAAVDITDDEDSRSFAVAMAREAWETKAEDTLVLHVAPLVYWTRYMVICTVFSKPQLNALLAKMTQQAKDVHGRELSHSVEGRSAWELLDYGDVVVHIMTAEQRDYYDLEGFYGAAEEVDLPFLHGGSQQQQGLGWQKRLA